MFFFFSFFFLQLNYSDDVPAAYGLVFNYEICFNVSIRDPDNIIIRAQLNTFIALHSLSEDVVRRLTRCEMRFSRANRVNITMEQYTSARPYQYFGHYLSVLPQELITQLGT